LSRDRAALDTPMTWRSGKRSTGEGFGSGVGVDFELEAIIKWAAVRKRDRHCFRPGFVESTELISGFRGGIWRPRSTGWNKFT